MEQSYKGLIIPALLFIIGAVFAGNEMLVGHSFATNDGLIWTLPLVVYMLLALISTGISIVLASGELLNLEGVTAQKQKLLLLAIALLLGAFAALFTELGSPLHAFWLFITPNFTSPIWYMGTFYSIELVLLTVKLWRELRNQHSTIDPILARATLLVALAACTTLGSVFGTAIGRTGFAGIDASVLTVILALVSGGAGLVLGSEKVGQPLAIKVLRYSSAAIAFLLAVKWIYLTRSSELLRTDWVNPLMFVLFAVASLFSQHLPKQAALLTLATCLWTELAFVTAGQLQSLGPKAGWFGTGQTYTPNLPEIGILVFGIGTALLSYQIMKLMVPFFSEKPRSI